MKPAKKVITYDPQGKENGFLMELLKDGRKTVAYLTACKPGAFKGYHLHRVRKAHYVCIKGRILITVYFHTGERWLRDEVILEPGDTMEIDINRPTGLTNIGYGEAWLINFPDPAYDPELTGEQVEYTEEELKRGVIK